MLSVLVLEDFAMTCTALFRDSRDRQLARGGGHDGGDRRCLRAFAASYR